MSYIGQVLKGQQLPKDLDWRRTSLVLVEGTFPNTCGHILLFVGGGFGHYFHFDGPTPYDYPRYIQGNSNFQTYLSQAGKRELMRKEFTIPHPEKAEARLAELMQGKWATVLISHNCATFAGTIIRAGGNFFTLPEHCPALELVSDAFWERIFGPIRKKLGTESRYQASHLR